MSHLIEPVSGRQIAQKGDTSLDDESVFGGKAKGLHRLPSHWTLPFFAVSVGNGRLPSTLDAAIDRLGDCPDGVLIRSSAVGEGMNDRGALESDRSAAEPSSVAETLERLMANADPLVRDRLGFVVQRWAPDAARGHLSNERRVSRDPRSWLCEAELNVSIQDRSFRFRVDSATKSAASPECDDVAKLAVVLRGVARELGRSPLRLHLEWVWDGKRVWLVQRDEDLTGRGPAPGSCWRGPVSTSLDEPLSVFRPAAECLESHFPKVNHVVTLNQLGLPHGDVRVLMDPAEIESLSRAVVTDRLAADLDRLIQAPLVVRTDVHAPTDHPVLMSRRTDTCRTRDELDSFLIDASRQLIEVGQDPSDIAFLAHRFVLAEAGVFCRARPDNPEARIDSTWGLPDSLFFYPHDTYVADIERGTVQHRVRCKPDYIDVNEDGEWVPRAAGSPWDWRRVLDDSTVLRVARIASVLANHLNEDLEVMFFVGGSGEPWVLPWFFKAVDHSNAPRVDHSQAFYVGDRATIRNVQDIADLEFRLRGDSSRRPVLTLRPDVELLRDKGFVDAVAGLAIANGLTVELEGSVLSHAFYLLETAQVAVRVFDPFLRRERPRTFGKLVRDHVPVKIRRHGELADVYHPDRSELLPLIKAKVVEEALEFYWSAGRSDGIEELADILELIRAAANVFGETPQTVEQVAIGKRAERGGFDAGVVLVETRPREDILDASRPNDENQYGARLRLRPRRPVRLPSRRMLLPLVPPEGWTNGRAYVLPLDSADELVLTYGADDVIVEVRPRRSEPDSRQLSLEL